MKLIKDLEDRRIEEAFAKKTYRDRSGRNFYVTFNMSVQGRSGEEYSVGDHNDPTIDEVGTNMYLLASTIADELGTDTTEFREIDDPPIVGVFIEDDMREYDDAPTALMLEKP